MIRYTFYLCTVYILTSALANANTNTIEDCYNTVECNIQSYLSSVELDQDDETATVFTNFLIEDEGDLYNVDFMMTEDRDFTVLSVEIEEEFYKVDSYSTQLLQSYEIDVAQISVGPKV